MRRRLPQSKACDGWAPSWKQLLRAIARGKGSAGFDGWTARELKLMSSTFFFVIQDLHDPWLDATKYLGANGMSQTVSVSERPDDIGILQQLLLS
eukprot:7680353-Pyramimonas_sp.AAC.1